MACGFYKIENKINQKVYIGQSTNIATRWRHHRSEGLPSKSKDIKTYSDKEWELI